MRKRSALRLIATEHAKAVKKFRPMCSYHEGYAILKEEVDELWEAIKDKSSTPEQIREEAVQVGAMALRVLIDLCEEPGE